MRILLVTDQYAPAIGGIETLLRQIARQLVERGHAVEVLTGSLSSTRQLRHEIDGIPVHRVDLVRAVARRDPFGVAAERARARAVVRSFRPDVIHAHDAGPVLWAVGDRGIPTLITVHTSLGIYEPAQTGPIARQIASSDWVTCVSRSVLEEVLGIAPEAASRASVIVNGVPPGPLPAAPDPGRRRIVALGRMSPTKGFDVLIRAFALIAHDDPTTELQLVGDGPARDELMALVEGLGLGTRVAMPGAVRHADVQEVLEAASVVAIPSRFEGMPLVALEAARAARAVVATPVQGLGEIVVNGVTGTIVPVDDPGALACALSGLLLDPARAAALGAAAYEHVTTNYSLESAVTAYETLYHRLAAELVTGHSHAQ